MNKAEIVFLILLSFGVIVNGMVEHLVYGATSDPAEFGNSTTTTCTIGGTAGNIVCSGTGTFSSIIANVTGTINSSDFWDNLDTPNDFTSIIASQIIQANQFSGALNWSYLQNYPAACPGSGSTQTYVSTIADSTTCTGITSLDTSNIQDVYLLNNGDISTGNIDLDDGVGESPKLRFLNANNNISQIYEQTDGDLFIGAADGFELSGNSFRMTTLTNCDTIDTDGTGVLSCGTDADTNAKTLCGDGSFLRGEASTTCRTSAQIISDGQIVSDTTPQLGGYLDTNGNNIGSTTDEIENIYITTNNKIFLGTGQEGEIFYDGTKIVIKLN